ncbi:TPA: hypothetical protein ACH3X1_001090 [Trebouxia sp. C0004]
MHKGCENQQHCNCSGGSCSPQLDIVLVLAPVVVQDSKDWKSQSQATYRSSQQCAKDPALYNDIPVAGIRTQLEMEAMLAEASTVAEAAPLPPQYQTNYQEEFQFCGPNTVRLGQRIMKTQDGTGDVCRDHTFLAESGMLPKAQADRVAVGCTAQPLSSSYRNPDVPVSIYSEAALQGQYGGMVYGSRISGPATFARNSDFSKPISEYSKMMDADSVPMAAEA